MASLAQKSPWSSRLMLAATASLALANPVSAQAEAPPTQTAATAMAVSNSAAVAMEQAYPIIDPALLDPAAVNNPAAQQRIIDEGAKHAAIAGPYFDSYGLTREAASAFTRARNQGDLPGAKDGQSAGDWWREAEPKLKKLMAEYKAEQQLPLYMAGGLAGTMGLALLGSGALGAYRRRKMGPPPSLAEKHAAAYGLGSGP
ncbi:MAG: hypothetical protein AAF213_11365 [Pseudomonadota bacterium]